MRARRAFVAVGLSLSVVAAACGSDDSSTSDTTAAATTAAETTAAETTAAGTTAAATTAAATTAAGTTAAATTAAPAGTTAAPAATTARPTATTARPAATTAAPAATTAAPAATTAAPTTASSLRLDQPVKIIGLFETRGESPSAVPNFADGAQLAVDQINAAGGIGGRPLEYQRIAQSGTDPVAAGAALNRALDQKPTAIVGFVSSATAIPTARTVAAGRVPVLYMTVAPQLFRDFTGAGAVGSEWGFLMRPRNTRLADEQYNWIIERTRATKIALLCINSAFGTTGCDAVARLAQAGGVQVVARETNAATDTNLTAQVQAIGNSGAQAVIAFTFPNPLGAFAQQMADSGFNIPIIGGASAGLAIASGAVKGRAATNLFGLDDCAPSFDQRPIARQFSNDFRAKYGYRADYSAAETYDAIYMVKAAVETAQSADPQKVADALRIISYEGACTTYKADQGQGMNSKGVILSYDADGNPKVEKELTLNI